MLFEPVNILKELAKERKKNREDTLMDEVHSILRKEEEREERILNNIRGNDECGKAGIIPSGMDPENIFSAREIRSICIKYRLRFLNSKLYRGDLPVEAIQKVKEFENRHQKEIKSFHIIAPKNFFELEDRYKDPLLFAPVGNNKYYLLAKWGKDMEWYRKLLYFPLRNFITLLLSIAFVCFASTFAIPESFFVSQGFPAAAVFKIKVWLSLHLLIFTMMIAVFLGATFHKNLSDVDWDSKLFN